MNPDIDITNTILKTKRLTLRPWRIEDLDDFYTYASVDGVGQMAGWTPHKNREESRVILQGFIEEKKTFALEHSGMVIGSLGIENYDEKRFAELADLRCREIGYVLAKPFWGNGLMAEAVNAVIPWLFEEVALDVILCGHFISNTQSQRVQEKCGFTHYSYGTFHTHMNTDEADEMNILWRRDWEKQSAFKGQRTLHAQKTVK